MENAIPTFAKNKKAHFFLQAIFWNKKPQKANQKLVREGHYIGAHSDKYLPILPDQDWKHLLTREKFIEDLKNSYLELINSALSKIKAPFFLPPYEWYNDTISQWSKEMDWQS